MVRQPSLQEVHKRADKTLRSDWINLPRNISKAFAFAFDPLVHGYAGDKTADQVVCESKGDSFIFSFHSLSAALTCIHIWTDSGQPCHGSGRGLLWVKS